LAGNIRAGDDRRKPFGMRRTYWKFLSAAVPRL